MERAFDLEIVAIEVTRSQIRLFVRTQITDGEDAIPNPEKADGLAVRDDLFHPAIGKFIELSDRLVIRH